MCEVTNIENEKNKHEWDLILEEYRTLRQEIANKMDKQYQIMGLGVGGITALLGLAFTGNGIFHVFLVLPLIIVACIFLYDAEKNSILNAGEYIRTIIEEPVFAENKKLGWERWLFENRDRTRTYDCIERSSLAILSFLYVMSTYGIIKYWPKQFVENILGKGPYEHIVIGIYLLFGLIIFKISYSNIRSKNKYLFKIKDNIEQNEADLNNGLLSERLKELFRDENIEFSKCVITTDKWKIVDNGKKENVYFAYKKGDMLEFYKL